MSANVISLQTRLPVAAPHAQAAAMPQWKSDGLDQRLAKFAPLLKALREGASDAAAVELFVTISGKSRATGYNWIKRYREGGVEGLAPRYTGKQRKDQPWHKIAEELGQLPSKPDNGDIAFQLRARGFNVTADQVRAFRRALPSNRAETSTKRLGANYKKLNHTPYAIRDWSHVPVGYQYGSDGHTCDFYIEHPVTGNPFQPELTFWYDARSQFIVDFWISGFENSFDIRMSLSRALLRWDNVPREIHVDRGAYKATVMIDEVAGYCAKLGIEPHLAIARNARSKPVEGEWALFRKRHSKFMQSFVHERTDDFFKRFSTKWARGEVERVSLRQCYDQIAGYVDQRNNEARKGLDNHTPAQLWSTLQRNPVLAPAVAICRPRVQRTVQNRRVRLDGRIYQAAELAAFESFRQDMRHAPREVIVEYDDWFDSQVWIYDLKGRFVCTAQLVGKRPGIPVSRVEERVMKTFEGQLKRAEIKLAELQGRTAGVLEHEPIETLPLTVAAERIDPSVRALADGHAFTPAPAPRRAPPRAAQLDARTAELLAGIGSAPAEPVTATTTPESSRYARARDIERKLAAGEQVSDADAAWQQRYKTSAEYRSQAQFSAAFSGI